MSVTFRFVASINRREGAGAAVAVRAVALRANPRRESGEIPPHHPRVIRGEEGGDVRRRPPVRYKLPVTSYKGNLCATT